MLGILFDVLRNRLSLASASVGIIDNIIHGALFAPPLTGDLLKDRIDTLHPPADDRECSRTCCHAGHRHRPGIVWCWLTFGWYESY